jgi:hypothetical protein
LDVVRREVVMGGLADDAAKRRDEVGLFSW